MAHFSVSAQMLRNVLDYNSVMSIYNGIATIELFILWMTKLSHANNIFAKMNLQISYRLSNVSGVDRKNPFQ